MARPREAGGLAEASKLLKEGLQLLAQREREVDRLLEDARERALLIRERAEEHAAQITAEAQAQRSELERLVATLRSEVEALRVELAELRSNAAPPPVPDVQAAPAEPAEPNGVASDDATDAPRWGRHATALGEPQAVRTKSSRGWLAWLKR